MHAKKKRRSRFGRGRNFCFCFCYLLLFSIFMFLPWFVIGFNIFWTYKMLAHFDLLYDFWPAFSFRSFASISAKKGEIVKAYAN